MNSTVKSLVPLAVQSESLANRSSSAISFREHLGVYVLASLSNISLTSSQYLAVSSAVASYLPVDPGTSMLISSYGRGPGIVLALLPNSLIFQGILSGLMLTLAISGIPNSRWKWAYPFLGVGVSGFVGYWLGAKFLAILELFLCSRATG